MNATVQSIAQMTSSAGPLVGDVSWWTMTDAGIPADRLRSLWTDAGLPEDVLPPLPTPSRVLKLAGRDALRGHHGLLFRPAGVLKDSVAFALVREKKVDGETRLDYEQVAYIVADIHGKTATDHPEDPIVQRIIDGFNASWGSFRSWEIRKAVLTTIYRCAAVALRESGGVYWTPAVYSETVHKVSGVVNALGGAASFAILPIHHTAEGSASIGAAARGGIETELAALKEEVDGFAARDVREGTLHRRLDTFSEIRNRVALYREVLAIEVADLDAKLDALTADVSKMLGTAKPSKASEAAEDDGADAEVGPVVEGAAIPQEEMERLIAAAAKGQ